jgi:hypothetical protein
MNEMSASIKELATALSKAQAEIKPAAINSTNPFLNSKYADLGAVIEAARPVLSKYSLAVSQLTTGGGGEIGVTTILMHTSGEWMSSTIALAVGDERGKSQAQVAGSIISYLRRYSLASILGIYAGEDTDGHTGNSKAAHKPAPAIQYPQHLLDIVNSDGILYIDLPDDKLRIMAASIRKAMPKADDDKQAQYALKLDAIKEIQAIRASK